MKLQLKSVGNPDLGQHAPLSASRTVEVVDFAQASQRCRQYIAFHNLGSGNWSRRRAAG